MAKQLRVGEEVTIRSKYDSLLGKIYQYQPGAWWRVEEVISDYGGGAKKAIRVGRPPADTDPPDASLTFFTWPVMLDRTEAQTRKNAAARKVEAMAVKLGSDAKSVEGLVAVAREAGLKGASGKKAKRAALNAMVEAKLAAGADETAA